MTTLLKGDQRDLVSAVELTRLGPKEMREPANPSIKDPATMTRDPLRGGFAAVSRSVPIMIQMRVLKESLRRGLRVKPTHSENLTFLSNGVPVHGAQSRTAQSTENSVKHDFNHCQARPRELPGMQALGQVRSRYVDDDKGADCSNPD